MSADRVVLAQLMSAAIMKHGFRLPTGDEPPAAYLEALIAHVARRDLTEAHELRLGKRAADWTKEEGLAYSEGLISRWRGPREALRGAPYGGYSQAPSTSRTRGCWHWQPRRSTSSRWPAAASPMLSCRSIRSDY